MDMPESVKVGAHSYSVVRKYLPQKSPEPNVGYIDFDGLRITVHDRLKYSKSQETLLHEVLHGCTDVAKIQDDEAFVNAVAPVLLQVLQDNPELVAYLTSSSKRTKK